MSTHIEELRTYCPTNVWSSLTITKIRAFIWEIKEKEEDEVAKKDVAM